MRLNKRIRCPTHFSLSSFVRVNSLECGALAPIWFVTTLRAIVEQHSPNKGRDYEHRTKAAPGRRTPRKLSHLITVSFNL